MSDLADEAMGDLASVTPVDETAGDPPVILDFQKEAATMQGCEYCGWYPCGCGG